MIEAMIEEVPPPVLWYLRYLRSFEDVELRCTKWFVTKQAAEAHAAWVNDGRGKVLSLTEYRSHG